MTDFNDIDKMFKEQQGDWDKQPNNATWDNLSDRLDIHAGHKQKVNKRAVRLSIAASLVLLLGMTFYFSTVTNNHNADMATAKEVNLDVAELEQPKAEVAPKSESNVASNLSNKNSTATYEWQANGEKTSEKAHVLPSIEDESSATVTSSVTKFNRKSENLTIDRKDYDGFFKTQDFDVSAAQTEPVIENEPSYNVENDELLVEDIEVNEDELYRELSEVIVANEVGMAAKKEAIESRNKDRSYTNGAISQENLDDAMEEKADLPATVNANYFNTQVTLEEHEAKKKAKSSRVPSAPSFGYKDGILSNKVIYIYYPTSENDSCNELIIKIEANQNRLLNCDFSKATNIIENNKVMRNLYNLTIDELKSMGKEEVNLDCDFSTPIKIIVEYGLDIKRFEETIYWDANCYISAKPYIKQFDKIVKALK